MAASRSEDQNEEEEEEEELDDNESDLGEKPTHKVHTIKDPVFDFLVRFHVYRIRSREVVVGYSNPSPILLGSGKGGGILAWMRNLFLHADEFPDHPVTYASIVNCNGAWFQRIALCLGDVNVQKHRDKLSRVLHIAYTIMMTIAYDDSLAHDLTLLGLAVHEALSEMKEAMYDLEIAFLKRAMPHVKEAHLRQSVDQQTGREGLSDAGLPKPKMSASRRSAPAPKKAGKKNRGNRNNRRRGRRF